MGAEMVEIQIHKSFGEFYRLTHLQPTAEILNQRWKAAVAFLTDATLSNKLDLVRFVLGVKLSSEGSIPQLRDKCIEVDPSFPAHDADLELKAIAAISIVQAIETDDEEAIPLALAVIAGECKGLRSLAPFGSVLERARVAAARASVEIRRNARLALADGQGKRVALDTLSGGPSDASSIQKGTVAAIAEASANTQKLQERTHSALSALAEESNILWWVLGEFSKDLVQPISTLSPAMAALVAAKELADVTVFTPGPIASGAFLLRLLTLTTGGGGTTLSDAVCSTSAKWRAGLVSEKLTITNDLSPVMMAVAKASETETGTDWHPAFLKATKISATTSIEPLKLGQQLFDELMLIRAISEE
jgi:hypothetical protein